MRGPGPWPSLAAIAALNVVTLVAGLAIVVLLPERYAPPRPASVAARTIVAPAPHAMAGERGSGGGPLPSPQALAAALSGPMRASGLGPSVTAAVSDPASGRSLFASRADTPAVPASTTKIVTAAAALAALGPGHRLTTEVVRSGSGVVLVGGGDPTLSSTGLVTVGASAARRRYPRPATLSELAKRTAAALRSSGVRKVTVDYDASLYTGPRTGPGWKPGYIPEGNVAPVTALQVDGGRVRPDSRDRVSDPPRAAATAFAALLGRHGVKAEPGRPTKAPAGAPRLAAVQSPPVSALVELLLTESDNDVAEAMARHVALKSGAPASFAGGADAVMRTLGRLGVARGIQVVDGSGLSTDNRITAAGLVRVLSLAASGRRPELRYVISGLPVGGFSGTLAARYGPGGAARPGAGVVRAKTGTLDGVSTLAGVAQSADGALLAFAFMADDAPSTAAAEPALDRLAATVAGCGCG